MSTRSTVKFERDEATGQEVHIYRDTDEPGRVLLDATGFAFEMDGPIHLSTEYPLSIEISFSVEQAQKLGLPVNALAVRGQSAAQVTIKFPEEWARKIGLIK